MVADASPVPYYYSIKPCDLACSMEAATRARKAAGRNSEPPYFLTISRADLLRRPTWGPLRTFGQFHWPFPSSNGSCRFEEGKHAFRLLLPWGADTLRRLVRINEVTPNRARQALEDLAGLPLEGYSHDVLISRVWALRENLTAYDAAYVALAEILEATLLTCDGRIRRAPGHSARVEVF